MENKDSYQQVAEPKYECLLFDVDDTLYPLSSGISVECTKNIIEYMTTKLGIDEEKASVMCVDLYRKHGTTMAGLKAVGYNFDYDDYHSFVHGRLPYEWLKTDHTLKNILHSLPIRKVIFSNGNEAHVAKVLSRLGLEDCFDDIISFETLNPINEDKQKVPSNYYGESTGPEIVCKPNVDAFEQAFKIADINPKKTLFFDDSIRNLQTAKGLGVQTVWVGSSHRTQGADYALESIHNIKEALPELWDQTSSEIHYSAGESAAIETYVRA